MSGLFPWDEIGPVIKNELSVVIYDARMLKKIVDACPSFEKPLKVHIKVDTGMGRLGFSVGDMAFVGQQLKGVPEYCLRGSHEPFRFFRDTGRLRVKTGGFISGGPIGAHGRWCNAGYSAHGKQRGRDTVSGSPF